MNNLTKRQKDILSVIEQDSNLSLSQIAKELGLSSVGNIHAHVKKLVDLGYIKKEGRKMFLTNKNQKNFFHIPFYGYAQAGNDGLFGGEDPLDYIPMPSQLLRAKEEDLFFMKVKGDSMEPTLKEEELVLFEMFYGNPVADIRKDDVILCKINDELKIKRYVITSEYGLLKSDNKAKYDPIRFDENDDVKILGKMKKLLF
ncbi:MAG: winged helix-turn-helix transcriptional regulator [Alphaproteobacteria bacterium]|jgi:repressor LexA|nr:winged helix-turn-helix transcriptional regulator [Alphaproteobacteria bacterium]MCV6599407.1 winged helix-turn-helix transcriptional regulator [Alphaproteobacteria bacterium]